MGSQRHPEAENEKQKPQVEAQTGEKMERKEEEIPEEQMTPPTQNQTRTTPHPADPTENAEKKA